MSSGDSVQESGGGGNGQTMIAVYALSATGGIILLCMLYAFCCRSQDDEQDLLPTRSDSTADSTNSSPPQSKNLKLCKLPSHTRLAVMPGSQVQLAVRATPSPCITAREQHQPIGRVSFEPPIRGVEGGQYVRPSSIQSGTEDSMFMYQASSFGDHPMIGRGLAAHLNISGRYDWRDHEIAIMTGGTDVPTEGSRTPSMRSQPRSIAPYLNLSGRYNWREYDTSHMVTDDRTEESVTASASIQSYPRQLAPYLNVSGRHYFRDTVDDQTDESAAYSINSPPYNNPP